MATAMESGGEWVCDRVLGSGSFGSVELWRAVHTQEMRAIKRCRLDYAQLNEKQKDRWKKEVEFMAGLNHPNIIATRPLPNELKKPKDILPVLCMEYCGNGDLRNVLNQSDNCCGVTEGEALQIMSHISSSVEYLHQLQITHRDLKPENIVLQEKNGKIIYKLIDLGFAKELGEQSMCASIVGTLNYLAPELMWKKTYSCSVDYWSLGILFYEVLTGTRPFLPHMTNTPEWVKHISRKSIQHICAHEINGEVVFGTDVEGPTDISEKKIVAWFSVVLQWDPKKRGMSEEPNQEVIVFKMLKEILSKKIIYVFCVPLYRIFSLDVAGDTTLEMLQSWIEKDTAIAVDVQILIDSTGEVLNMNNLPMLNQLQDSCITLFKQGSILVETLPEPDVPRLVLTMAEQTRIPTDYQRIKRYYSATIFFFKQELKLFRSYILALSMKIDLVNTRLNTLKESVNEMLRGTRSLKSEVASISSSHQKNMMNVERKEAFDAILSKTEKLSETANQIEAKCKSTLQRGESLMEFTETDWLANFQAFYDGALDVFESFRKDTASRKKSLPNGMTKLVFKFLKHRKEQINNRKIADIASTILQLEEELTKLEGAINSASALTVIYHERVLNLEQQMKLIEKSISFEEETASSSDNGFCETSASSLTSSVNGSSNTSDNVIYDNLVLRHIMQDFISELQKKYKETMNLNP